MGVKVKPKMSKKAAQSAAAKGKSKPASKKAAKPKTSKPKKVKASPTVGLIVQNQEQRVARAQEIRARMEEIIPEVAAHSVEMANMAAEVKRDQLWKEEGFDSWTAWGEHYAKMMQVGRSSLFAMLGAMKALPGVTAEQRAKIGPRKVEKLKRAAKIHKKKTGEDLPVEIIEKAATEPEKQFDDTLRKAELAPDMAVQNIIDASTAEMPSGDNQAGGFVDASRPDPLLHQDKSEQPFRRGKKQASGAVEGSTGDAQQFGSVVEQAVMAQQIITPKLSKIAALELIAAQWLKFPCIREDLQDMTNEQAAEHLSGGSASTAKKRRKK